MEAVLKLITAAGIVAFCAVPVLIVIALLSSHKPIEEVREDI